MAASTRSGLPGGFSGGGDGPTDVQSARTLYGHDLHLEPGSVDVSPAQPVNQPSDESDEGLDSRPVTTEEEFTPPARFPSHSGKSRFPALARLFGRWNTQGRFERRLEDDDLDVVPRERVLRPLAIVVATSAISFFIVVALLKLRDSTSAEPPAAAVSAPAPQPLMAPVPAAPVAAPRPAPPAPAAVAPAPAAQPAIERPAPMSDALRRAIARRDAPPSPTKRAAPRRSRRMVVPADPDGPMPLSF
ncbi:MAG TPA: hypothetical protein VN914_00440 [Polyangia bacterium]|nr:hypothetical protein [Polyangia bacterium]